jgi:hypothetical protein
VRRATFIEDYELKEGLEEERNVNKERRRQ